MQGGQQRCSGRLAGRSSESNPPRERLPARSDIPLKEFIAFLDESLPSREKFVLRDLDDTHLFIKEDRLTFVQAKVKVRGARRPGIAWGAGADARCFSLPPALSAFELLFVWVALMSADPVWARLRGAQGLRSPLNLNRSPSQIAGVLRQNQFHAAHQGAVGA